MKLVVERNGWFIKGDRKNQVNNEFGGSSKPVMTMQLKWCTMMNL